MQYLPVLILLSRHIPYGAGGSVGTTCDRSVQGIFPLQLCSRVDFHGQRWVRGGHVDNHAARTQASERSRL